MLLARGRIESVNMKHIIQFHIYKGGKYYVAQGIDLPIITQGKNLDELAENIREAVEVHLKGENLASLNLAPRPSIMANLELETKVYA